jgi:DDE family transposase
VAIRYRRPGPAPELGGQRGLRVDLLGGRIDDQPTAPGLGATPGPELQRAVLRTGSGVATARRLLGATIRRHMGRRRRVKRVAFDSTGLDCGQRSFYYVRRRCATSKRWQRVTYSRYAKLELAVDTANHLVLAALTGRGPRPDTDRFVPLLKATRRQVRVQSALADAGYDSEPNHRFAREECGVRSFMPATIGRPTAKPPSGRNRRRMKQRLNKHYGRYGQRWQVECTNSMIKRRLTATVAARSYWAQCRELLLIVLTYQCMLVLDS